MISKSTIQKYNATKKKKKKKSNRTGQRRSTLKNWPKTQKKQNPALQSTIGQRNMKKSGKTSLRFIDQR
jgi:hypothetical protein